MALAPPEAEACLDRSRVDKWKGGTLIAEDVRTLAAHARTVRDPDGYRPDSCPRCGFGVLHVHGYATRRLFGEYGPGGPGVPPPVRIVIYICAHHDCQATWRVLPFFLARHLWRAWSTVERTVKPEDTPVSSTALPIPKETRRRWLARFVSAARVLVALLATSNAPALEQVAGGLGYRATRAEVALAYADAVHAAPGGRLAPIAALAHRLIRGIRLM